jgi:dTDP-4-dehydrorhamnose 3,5-epimerase
MARHYCTPPEANALFSEANLSMNVITTELRGLLIVEPRVFGDSRGFFFEGYHKQRYLAAGIEAEFVQDNYSRSCRGTLRGLHYQITKPQGKLVQVTRGEVFDVAVDLRRSSPTFGRAVGVILNEENHRQIYIPPGFAHGFCVISETADFAYKCTEFYDPADERTLLWNDSVLGIDWPDVGMRILSAKDERGLLFSQAETYP